MGLKGRLVWYGFSTKQYVDDNDDHVSIFSFECILKLFEGSGAPQLSRKQAGCSDRPSCQETKEVQSLKNQF